MAKLEIGRKGASLLAASRKMLQDALPTTSSCLGLLTLGRKRTFSQHLATQQDQSSSTLLGEVCSSSIFAQLEKIPWPLSAKWSYCREFWWSHSSSSANVWMQLFFSLPFRLLSEREVLLLRLENQWTMTDLAGLIQPVWIYHFCNDPKWYQQCPPTLKGEPEKNQLRSYDVIS